MGACVDRVIGVVRRRGLHVVALSVLLTPMVGQRCNVLEALTQAGLRNQVQVVIGGACTAPCLAEEMGCDAHGPGAVAAV